MSLVSTSTWRAGLVNLHAGHQSEDSMLRRAGQLIYRPDIDARVEQKQQQCQEGEIQPPSHPSETLLPTPSPQYPRQVAMNIFQLNRNYT